MLVPIEWMRDYVSLEESDRTLTDRVNDSGSHVDAVENLGENNSGIVAGLVKDIREDDALKTVVIVDVDVKSEVITVVTGAKNVKVGDKVLLAKVGAKLPGGKEISAAQVGPVLSSGMLCSYDELGFSENVVPKSMHDGIVILGDDVEIGVSAKEALGLTHPVVEFEITPNRPDCLSIIGMARETAATFQTELTLPELKLKNEDLTAEAAKAQGLSTLEDAFKGVRIETEDCTRFVYRVIDDVKIAPSPQWLQNRLMQAGMRPINNVVDLTNYVMLEYGQPMHAYDIETIRGNEIVVRKAKQGEHLTTLDGVDHELDEDVMLICDAEGAIGLAGVMGGLDSEIRPTTKRILLETAVFSEENVQSTSKKLKLRTEASTRFEKGVNFDYAEDANKRMCALVEELGVGITLPGRGDVITVAPEKKTVTMRVDRCNALLGTDISKEQMQTYLEALELPTTYKDGALTSEIPNFRHDLSVEVDLIEEVARLYGIGNIEPKPLVGTMTRGIETDMHRFANENREALYSLGFDEILTYSFGTPKNDEKLALADDSPLKDKVVIQNPLGEDFSVMRTNLLANLLDVMSRNRKAQNDDLLFYEVSNTFRPKASKKELPDEVIHGVIGMSGEYDFYDLKSHLAKWMEAVGVKNLRFEAERENPTFHPGRTARVYADDTEIGIMGEVHPTVLERFDVDKPVLVAEIDLQKAFSKHAKDKRYTAVGRFPSMVRDIALVVDKDASSEEIEAVIRENGSALLQSVKLFDIYTGEQIEQGKKSLAYQLSFASNERTLKDEEVTKVFDDVLQALDEKYGIQMRA